MTRSIPLLAALAACSPSIADLPLDTDTPSSEAPVTDTPAEPADPTDPTDPPTDPVAGPFSAPDADGVVTVRLDASDAEAWVYADLDGAALTDAAGAWTLAAKRSDLMLNGGVSGAAGVEVAWSPEPFAAATEAPAAGWTTDAADADADGTPEYALATWYDYDVTTHTLTPSAGTWFVRTAGGDTVAVEFLGYYDDAGTSGFPSFRYKPVAAPPDDPTYELTVDASDRAAFLYVELDAGVVVDAPATPTEDDTWDLAIRRTTLQTNGGHNGAGQGAAYTFPEATAWEEATEVPVDGWQEDEAPPSPFEDGTALATWYDYDPATHAVSPSGRIHAVRDADGDRWRLTVTAWVNGVITLRVAPLEAL